MSPPSTGSTGDSFDNALAENLWSTIKIELLCWPGTTFATRREAEHALIRYLDGWYNPRRIQARLEGLSPDEYEDNYRRAQPDADRQPALRETGGSSSTRFIHRTGPPVTVSRRPTGAPPPTPATARLVGLGRSPG